jgi:DNA end-binding protein Ku
LSEDFKAQKYHDTFQEQLKALVESKEKGRTITEKPVPKRAKVIDMMDALKKSLQQAESEGRRRRVAADAAAAPRAARRIAS